MACESLSSEKVASGPCSRIFRIWKPRSDRPVYQDLAQLRYEGTLGNRRTTLRSASASAVLVVAITVPARRFELIRKYVAFGHSGSKESRAEIDKLMNEVGT
jgi:hypothetical protein